MQLSTQIRRFTVSSFAIALLAGFISLQPRSQDQLSEQAMAELPIIIIVEKEPGQEPVRAWRQMLPASLAARRS